MKEPRPVSPVLESIVGNVVSIGRRMPALELESLIDLPGAMEVASSLDRQEGGSRVSAISAILREAYPTEFALWRERQQAEALGDSRHFPEADDALCLMQRLSTHASAGMADGSRELTQDETWRASFRAFWHAASALPLSGSQVALGDGAICQLIGRAFAIAHLFSDSFGGGGGEGYGDGQGTFMDDDDFSLVGGGEARPFVESPGSSLLGGGGQEFGSALLGQLLSTDPLTRTVAEGRWASWRQDPFMWLVAIATLRVLGGQLSFSLDEVLDMSFTATQSPLILQVMYDLSREASDPPSSILRLLALKARLDDRGAAELLPLHYRASLPAGEEADVEGGGAYEDGEEGGDASSTRAASLAFLAPALSGRSADDVLSLFCDLAADALDERPAGLAEQLGLSGECSVVPSSYVVGRMCALEVPAILEALSTERTSLSLWAL